VPAAAYRPQAGTPATTVRVSWRIRANLARSSVEAKACPPWRVLGCMFAFAQARRLPPPIANSVLDVRPSSFDVPRILMKRYLITGASRGIGRAIAEQLAATDVTLFLHGRDTVALAEVCQSVKARSARVIPLIHDLALAAGVSNLIEEIGSEPIDLLVNNAGIAVVKPFGEITSVEWEQTLGVNVTAPFLMTQHFAPRMPPGSSIVNILSVAARTGFANWSAYCMSKFALEGFSQSVREELRDHKIRVINVYPAATNTEIWNGVQGDWPREKMMPPAEIAGAVAYALSRPGAGGWDNNTLTRVLGRL